MNELLSEFKRQGFDVSNWDGEEGAEKAIVDGVVNHIAAQQEKYSEEEIAAKQAPLLLDCWNILKSCSSPIIGQTQINVKMIQIKEFIHRKGNAGKR